MSTVKERRKGIIKRVLKIAYLIIGMLMIFFGLLIIYAADWSVKAFGKVSFAQLWFHIRTPLNSTADSIIYSFIEGAVYFIAPYIILFTIPLFFNFDKRIEYKVKFKNKEKNIFVLFPTPFKIYRRFFCVIGVVIIITGLIYDYRVLGVDEYLKYMKETSSVFEEYYVDTKEVEITFPERKKNLIYIYVESLEATFASRQNGGDCAKDFIPNLVDYSHKYTHFSSNYEGSIAGASQVYGTTWTTAGVVAMSAGIPILLPIEGNGYFIFKEYLPGAYTIGDVLENEGYNQEVMLGSLSEFGGVDNLFTQHGSYKIYDYYTAIEEGKIDDDYYEWWGFEDKKLFEYAKEEILKLSKKDEPFNFTMFTMDTHYPHGYYCDLCEYDSYPYVIKCSDSQIVNFVEWVKTQEFYKDTVIVISGDHLSMSSDVSSFTAFPDYERTTYNVFINDQPDVKMVGNGNYTKENITKRVRAYTTMDMFPTTLTALGCIYEPDRLGIGTDLYSGEKTLTEIYGVEELSEELKKNSKLYNSKILK